MAIDPNLAPGDAIVALRSLPRRYEALFGGIADDERPDDLVQHAGSDGWTPIGHVVAASRAIALVARAIQEVLLTADPLLERAVVDKLRRVEDPAPGGSIDDRVSELGWEVDALADLAEGVHGKDWIRSGSVTGHSEPVTALDLLRIAVEAGIDHLRAAEATIREIRQRRGPLGGS